MNGDPDVLLPILDFYSLYGLDDHPVIIDLLQSLKDHASVRLINGRAKYVDHLAHLRGERKTFHMDLTTGLPANSLPEHGTLPRRSHALEHTENTPVLRELTSKIGDPRIAAPSKPPCDSDTKDQETDPPFRYVHITKEEERINRGPALSSRSVGTASDGCDGGNTNNSEGSA